MLSYCYAIPMTAPPRFACPHCQALGITDSSRNRSSRGWPAKCLECGKLSYNGSRALRFLASGVATIIMPTTLLLLVFVRNTAAFTALVVLVAGIVLLFLIARRADENIMRPVTAVQSQRSRALTYSGLALIVVVIGAVVWKH